MESSVEERLALGFHLAFGRPQSTLFLWHSLLGSPIRLWNDEEFETGSYPTPLQGLLFVSRLQHRLKISGAGAESITLPFFLFLDWRSRHLVQSSDYFALHLPLEDV